jgi:hypothetical protein
MQDVQGEKKTRSKGKALTSYPVSVQIKTIVNAAEKFDEKNLAKLIQELSNITEKQKEKKRTEIQKKIEELSVELKSL